MGLRAKLEAVIYASSAHSLFSIGGRLSSAGDAPPENESNPRPSAEANFERRDPAGSAASGQRPFDTQQNQQVGPRASVFRGSVPTRHPATAVRRPPTLPKWVEAEAGDQVSPGLESVTSDPKPRHQTIPNVDPGRHAHAVAGFHCAGAGEKPVNSHLALKCLGGVLGAHGRGGRERGTKRENDGNQSALEQG